MNTPGRWMKWCFVIPLCVAASVQAQEESKQPRKIYTRNTVFKLPIQIDESDRLQLSGLKLYVKCPPAAWQCQESAPASQVEFSYHAPRDGEYWFGFATVDKAGTVTPAKPDAEAPGLIVVVDTQPPDVSVKPVRSATGPAYLQCKILDANPDYRSIKLEYQSTGASSRGWIALEPVVAIPGMFQLPDVSVLSAKIRVQAKDLAGNSIEREFDLGSTPAPATPSGSAARKSPTIVPVASTSERKSTSPAPVPVPVIPASLTPVDPPAPLPLPSDLGSAKPLITNPTPAPTSTLPTREIAATSPPTPTPNPSKTIAIINSRKLTFTVRMDGRSKESWIEIWATSDGGKSWTRVGENPTHATTIPAEFPADGAFGYTFVVKSPTGGDSAPTSRDSPDGWIEIDTTKPVAELITVALGSGEESGTLLLTWLARDRNFGADPISLYYSAQRTGPWQPIAEKIANDGTYRWALPRNLSGTFFVRLSAADRAGNISICDFPTPVQVETKRPNIKLLSLTATKE